MVEQQLEELSNRIKKDSKSNTGSRLPDKSHYSDLESFTLDMGGLAIESEKQPMVEKDKKGTPPDESKNLEMTEEQIQELMKKKKQTEYLTDFKDPEVNNYWRFKKLEEQEQNSDDPGADEQEELDKDSEDSQTQRDKNAADELMLLLGKKKEKTTKFGDQDQPGEKKIRKQKTKTLTKQATALDSFRKLNPEQQKEALKKKRDEDERIRRMTSLSDFRDSQIQYRNYMDHRKRFNTHED